MRTWQAWLAINIPAGSGHSIQWKNSSFDKGSTTAIWVQFDAFYWTTPILHGSLADISGDLFPTGSIPAFLLPFFPPTWKTNKRSEKAGKKWAIFSNCDKSYPLPRFKVDIDYPIKRPNGLQMSFPSKRATHTVLQMQFLSRASSGCIFLHFFAF